jgi:hypothetical protein
MRDGQNCHFTHVIAPHEPHAGRVTPPTFPSTGAGFRRLRHHSRSSGADTHRATRSSAMNNHPAVHTTPNRVSGASIASDFKHYKIGQPTRLQTTPSYRERYPLSLPMAGIQGRRLQSGHPDAGSLILTLTWGRGLHLTSCGLSHTGAL